MVLAGKRRPSAKGDLYAGGVVNHVTVCKNQTVRGEDETRSAPLPLAGLARPPFRRLRNINLDHRGAELFGSSYDRLRVSIEQDGITQRTAT